MQTSFFAARSRSVEPETRESSDARQIEENHANWRLEEAIRRTSGRANVKAGKESCPAWKCVVNDPHYPSAFARKSRGQQPVSITGKRDLPVPSLPASARVRALMIPEMVTFGTASEAGKTINRPFW